MRSLMNVRYSGFVAYVSPNGPTRVNSSARHASRTSQSCPAIACRYRSTTFVTPGSVGTRQEVGGGLTYEAPSGLCTTERFTSHQRAEKCRERDQVGRVSEHPNRDRTRRTSLPRSSATPTRSGHCRMPRACEYRSAAIGLLFTIAKVRPVKMMHATFPTGESGQSLPTPPVLRTSRRVRRGAAERTPRPAKSEKLPVTVPDATCFKA